MRKRFKCIPFLVSFNKYNSRKLEEAFHQVSLFNFVVNFQLWHIYLFLFLFYFTCPSFQLENEETAKIFAVKSIFIKVAKFECK